MKYKKLELIRGGDNPLIRITYEKFRLFGKNKLIVRDVVKCTTRGFEKHFIFCDTGSLNHDDEVLTSFYLSKETIQEING